MSTAPTSWRSSALVFTGVGWEGVSVWLIGVEIKDLSSKKAWSVVSSSGQIEVVLWESPLGLWLQ